MPAFFLFVYGYALNFDIRNIALAVEDNDQSTASRQLVSAFVRSGYFDLTRVITGDDEVSPLFDKAIAAERLFGLRLDGLWMHVGTPDAVKAAEAALIASAA